MGRGDHVERPPTTRVGPAGGSGRGLRTLIALASLALSVAVLKPWDWVAAPSAGPGREGAAIAGILPAVSPTVVRTPASQDWTGAGPQVACLSGTSWLAVVDQVNGPVTSRSWTRLDLVPASGPLDPAIARTHVYAEAVPRIGFCAPGSASAAGAPGSASAAGAPGAADGVARFLVRTWRLTPPEAAAGGSATPPSETVPPGTAPPGPQEAIPVAPPLVSGGRAADGGALYGPPGWLTVGAAAGRAADPEDSWAARGPVPLPGDWTPGGGLPEAASWPPGTYVFRVGIPDAGSERSEVAWFAIELRGPWTGWSASSEPEQTP